MFKGKHSASSGGNEARPASTDAVVVRGESASTRIAEEGDDGVVFEVLLKVHVAWRPVPDAVTGEPGEATGGHALAAEENAGALLRLRGVEGSAETGLDMCSDHSSASNFASRSEYQEAQRIGCLHVPHRRGRCATATVEHKSFERLF